MKKTGSPIVEDEAVIATGMPVILCTGFTDEIDEKTGLEKGSVPLL